MKFEIPYNPDKEVPSVGTAPPDPVIHPFVNAFANIGAMMGRDLGVVALHAVEIQSQRVSGACLVWAKEQVPDVIRTKVPQDLRDKLVVAILVPPGVAFPPFQFGEDVQAMQVTVIDGSQLTVFVKP